jgi:hypothetical protein
MPAKEAAGGEIVSHQHPQGRSLQGAQIVGHAMRCACAHRGTVRSNRRARSICFSATTTTDVTRPLPDNKKPPEGVG